MTEPPAGDESPRLVLSSAPDPEQASRLARELVERRLAACVNLLPGARSVYRWQGRVEDETETLMLIKTTAGRLALLQAVLLDLHPYDTPELVVLEPERVEARYLAWLVQQVARVDSGGPQSP